MIFLYWFRIWKCFIDLEFGILQLYWFQNGFRHAALLPRFLLRITVRLVRILDTITYASEPQRRVWDFCISLPDLSEVRRALNFPSRAGNL